MHSVLPRAELQQTSSALKPFGSCCSCGSQVLNNLVIAVIVNNAFARAEQDEELQASIARETTESELNDLRQLFDELLPNEDAMYLTRKDWDLRRDI